MTIHYLSQRTSTARELEMSKEVPAATTHDRTCFFGLDSLSDFDSSLEGTQNSLNTKPELV